MSRELHIGHPHAYRVVMEYGYGKRYIGPYATRSAAKGQLSTRLDHAKRYDPTAQGWIEKTSGSWEKLDD